ncbi:MAG: bifunctional folylpolyglutamate synthase/dihydrofolate synthase [Chloroflexi bacterium]|nr:bifunctional folylpolyglutamate synthase/dihydrofolate synthase [Chloroflexota bacterium]
MSGSTGDTAVDADRERAALDWLLSFSDWERGIGWSARAAPAEAWNLGRIRLLLDAAGAPDRGLRVVLVAGTKGKGSTSTFLESIVRACGWQTGLYTQPHVHRYRERFRIDGEVVSAKRFADLTDRLRPLVERVAVGAPEAGAPTTFELMTALAVLAFAEAHVDLAIMEVGLGGRLDATNALDPLISVITTIGLDHRQVLGATLAKIAAEKAGILRPGRVAIIARQRRPARDAIAQACKRLGAACRFVGPLRVVRARALENEEADETAAGQLGNGERFRARLRLAGAHQRQNAALAVAAAEALTGDGLPLTGNAVRLGLERAWLPARFEVIANEPTYVIDAAHNVDSARALVDTLWRSGLSAPIWVVLGILRDKDARAVARPLAAIAAGIVATTAPSPRGLAADDLARVCHAAGAREVRVARTVGEALAVAARAAGPHGTVVATGSFTVAGEAREALGLAADQGPPLTLQPPLPRASEEQTEGTSCQSV